MSKKPLSAEAAIETSEEEQITFAEFLERTPPGTPIEVVDAIEYGDRGAEMATPEIQLHCPSDQCNGVRVFRSGAQIGVADGQCEVSSDTSVPTVDQAARRLHLRC